MPDTLMNLISEDEFDFAFNPLEVTPHGDRMVYSYVEAERIAKEKGLSKEHIWTIVEGDDDSLYAQAGCHVVNTIGFVVTEKPWVSGVEEAVWYDASEELEDEAA